jgi:hypothetical protein
MVCDADQTLKQFCSSFVSGFSRFSILAAIASNNAETMLERLAFSFSALFENRFVDEPDCGAISKCMIVGRVEAENRRV